MQDIAKVATYWLMAKLNVGQQHEVDVRLVSGKIRAAIDTENRNDRIRGRGKQITKRAPSLAHSLLMAACMHVHDATCCV